MRKGVINKGLVKKTYKQEKKHYTQLSEEELSYLEDSIYSLGRITPSWHLVEKNNLLIKKNDILKILKDPNIKDLIVEYNVTSSSKNVDKRVLLRSRDVYMVDIDKSATECNLCFVISIIKGEVVTAYYNEIDDDHKTIDWNRYNKDLKVF